MSLVIHSVFATFAQYGEKEEPFLLRQAVPMGHAGDACHDESSVVCAL